jgi:hypothetical protein
VSNLTIILHAKTKSAIRPARFHPGPVDAVSNHP